MEIKTIEQIEEDYSKNNGWSDFGHFLEDNTTLGKVKIIRDICSLYASQFQTNTDLLTTEICVLRERVAELEEHMKECASVLSWVLDNARPDSDWQTFTNSVMNAMVEAESLINKDKDNGI